MHATLGKRPLHIKIFFSKAPGKASQMKSVSACTVPLAMLRSMPSRTLFCNVPWTMHATLVNSPLPIKIFSSKAPGNPSQMKSVPYCTAPLAMLRNKYS
jgi:hypothetical protein